MIIKGYWEVTFTKKGYGDYVFQLPQDDEVKE